VDKLEEKIFNNLDQGKSVILVGPTGSGKSWFVHNKLIPFCESQSKTWEYVDGYPDKHIIGDTDVVIVDEFETFTDKDFLEKQHSEEVPYYENDYIENISAWHQYLAGIEKSKLYILTRNEITDIDFVLRNVDKTDWSEPVAVYEYVDKRE
jgi:nicotinamide riboside kinase